MRAWDLRYKRASTMKKRIVITLKDITESGGGERVGANLANAFALNLGYEVQIVSFFKSGAKPFYPLDSRISCIYLCNRPAKAKNAFINLFNKTIFRAWLIFKAQRFATQSDIILANDGWFVPLFKSGSRSKGRFFVRLWHINAPKKARKKLRLFDALVILSEREIQRWQRYHSNINAIPNFLPDIPQTSTNHSQKVVLSVGRLSSEKGFLRLLDIWKIVREHIASSQDNLSQWKLIIVGDGVLKSEIESKINALNLSQSVILKPFTKDIEREYLGASIYAMASHFEGFPMVLLESTSYGLAPLSFDIATGPSDIIEHNKSGFLILDNDLEGYARHLIALMSDESMRANFGKEAKRIVSERFGKESVINLWEKLFTNF